MNPTNLPKSLRLIRASLAAILVAISGVAIAHEPSSPIAQLSAGSTDRHLHLQPAPATLLEMLRELSRLPLPDLQNPEKIIAISKLPLHEKIERAGQSGVSRFFSLEKVDSPIAFGTYWYRKPAATNWSNVYFSISINASKFCLSRVDVEKVFGNVWLTGFRNDRMPGAVPRFIAPEESSFGAMTYLLDDDRLINFAFKLDQPSCVANISFNRGKDNGRPSEHAMKATAGMNGLKAVK